MKSFLYTGLAFIAALLAGCSTDSDKDMSQQSGWGKNEFTFFGRMYGMAKGNQYYYGETQSGKAEIGLQLLNGDATFSVDFYIYVPQGKELTEGSYTYSAAEIPSPGTFSRGRVIVGASDGEGSYGITGGGINIAISKGKYVVNVDCITEGDMRLVGNYTGGIMWEDWSKEATAF